MELKIEIRGNVYSICIGYKTQWFAQINFITIVQEWYDHKEVTYADMLWHS